MKATLLWFAAVVLTAVAASPTQAHPFHRCCSPPCPPPVTNAFSSGCWCPNPWGPNYGGLPPFPPFNGFQPSLGTGNAPVAFPVHPFARSPRDYFMMEQ